MTDTKKELKTTNTTPLMAAPNGALVGSTLEEQYRIAKYYVQSGMLPKGYDTPEKVLIGFQYAIELGVKPLTAIKNICVINNQPNLWGELPLALARKSGELEKISEYFIDKDYKEISLKNKNLHSVKWAAICTIKRKGQDEEDFSWTVDDVAKAKKGPVWTNYPQIMWKRKVRAIALKDVFGDVLGTFDIAEYNNDRSPDVPKTMKDVTPQKTAEEASQAITDVANAEVEPIPMKDAIKLPLKDDEGKIIGEGCVDNEGKFKGVITDPEFKLEEKISNVSVGSSINVDKIVDKVKKEPPTGNPI